MDFPGPVESVVEPGVFQADSADIYINTRCNFGCETCFLGDDYFARDMSMTAADVGAIGRWLVRAGVGNVAVLGGEPTLHRDVVGIFEALRSSGIDQLRLITNGTPRARRLLAGPLAELVDRTYVSLDGATPAVNDALRGKGTFRHAMLAIELLRDKAMPFVITSTLGRDAVEQLDELLELAETSGCETLNIHWLSSVGRARHRHLAVSAERWARVVSYIAEYSPRRRDLQVECQVGSVSPRSYWARSVDPRACAVRDRTNLQFMPDGQVFSCGLLVDTPRQAAYRWDGGSLLQRKAPSELSLCCTFERTGCPVRTLLLGEESARDSVPVCIYERVVRGG
jgi:MoaA/NifB/PqqE/SkfB family radical SAM enzyme